jgi:hypothetical protein
MSTGGFTLDRLRYPGIVMDTVGGKVRTNKHSLLFNKLKYILDQFIWCPYPLPPTPTKGNIFVFPFCRFIYNITALYLSLGISRTASGRFQIKKLPNFNCSYPET